MTKLDQERRQARRRGLNLSNSQALAAAITGVCTITAAFITGAYKGHSLGLGPAPHVSVTKTIYVTPTPTVSASVAASRSSQSAASEIPVLTPAADSGFKQTWHGSVSVGAAGARILSSGVYQGTPQDWDIAYQPGGGDAGWQMNDNNTDNGYIWYWDGTGTPDPAFCSREYSASSGNEPSLAKLGDKYCYGDTTGLVGYMQVTNVSANGVTLAVWLWDKTR